jgi:hypothetical protein
MIELKAIPMRLWLSYGYQEYMLFQGWEIYGYSDYVLGIPQTVELRRYDD